MTMTAADPRAYGDSFADVYDDWYGDLSDPADLVASMQARCGPAARILELGAGTGRLALPLAAAGFIVTALDASVPMLRQMQTKDLPAGDEIRSAPLAADMAALPLASASQDAAFVAFNTFFNLDTEEQQRACLLDVARVLKPGAFVAIEAFIPLAPPESPAIHFDVTEAPARTGTAPPQGRALAIATRVDEATGRVTGAHLDFGPHGLRVRPWHIRYLSPAALDALAAECGLILQSRFHDWKEDADTPVSSRHVSFYRRPAST